MNKVIKKMSTPPQGVIDSGVLSDMNQAEKDALLLKLLRKEESCTPGREAAGGSVQMAESLRRKNERGRGVHQEEESGDCGMRKGRLDNASTISHVNGGWKPLCTFSL